MAVGRFGGVIAAGVAAVLAVAMPVPAVAGGGFAPVGTPGPALSVPAPELRRSLVCSSDLAEATRSPVLLVPATAVTPQEHYSWNYMRTFDALGWPYCSVATPKHAMEDLQISGEYVVHAIRAMYAASGRRVSVLGGSQGGSLPRWALRFWPDTRVMVGDQIGLAPTNHGGQGFRLLCQPDCAPAYWQQLDGSAFTAALNSGQETFPGIDYTAIYTRHEQFVTPAQDDTGSSSLHGGGGRVTNVALQDVCPAHVAEHLQAASFDAVGAALALDALTHDGPADPDRIPASACTQGVPPGADPVTFVGGAARAATALAVQIATAARVGREPPLRCYVTVTCERF